jgi:hypothetical protein
MINKNIQLKKLLFTVTVLLVIVFPGFGGNISFSGHVRDIQNNPLENYTVFFRFFNQPNLPSNFSMNGPAITSNQNGSYTFTLQNLQHGVQYYAKIYAYDSNLNTIEKTFSFYADGCHYSVYPLFINPITHNNTIVNFSFSDLCVDCPAEKKLTNNSTNNLKTSALVSWEWESNQHVFETSQSCVHFISSPSHTTVTLRARAVDPYTEHEFFESSKTKELVNDHNFFFHLGGQIFSGTYPVATSGVVLYKKANNIYTPIDTMVVATMGYYYFAYMPKCAYIVKVFPDPNQMKNDYYLPTYYTGSASWTDATILNHSNNGTTLTVQLLNASTTTGTYYIQGKTSHPDLSPATRCEVLLYNEDFHPIQYCLTDDQGDFQFAQLPMGVYYLTYDVPGIQSPVMQVILHEGNPFDYVDFIIGNQTNTSFFVKENQTHIFPNPFQEYFHIVSMNENDESPHIIVRDMKGGVVYETLSTSLSRKTIIRLPNIHQGNYLIELYYPRSQTRETHLILKTH